jgi:hypothetical protein
MKPAPMWHFKVAYYNGRVGSLRLVFNDIICWLCISNCLRVACWSKLTTSMDESERMAYSKAFVPSLSSNGNDQGHAEINVETTLIHGGSWGVSGESPKNNPPVWSHAR